MGMGNVEAWLLCINCIYVMSLEECECNEAYCKYLRTLHTRKNKTKAATDSKSKHTNEFTARFKM